MKYGMILLLSLCVSFTTPVQAGEALRYVYEIVCEADEWGNSYHWRSIPFERKQSESENENEGEKKNKKESEKENETTKENEAEAEAETDAEAETEAEAGAKAEIDAEAEAEAFALFQFFFDTVRYCVPEGVRVLSVLLDNGTLTVNVSSEILCYGGNAFERALIAQCLATAAGLPYVSRFTLMVEGQIQSLTEGRTVSNKALSYP